MAFGGKKAFLIFAGDIAVFVFSLWVTLLLRYGALPSQTLFLLHLQLFWILFLGWTLVFYIAGLYSKRALLTQHELTGAILRTQLLNITLAALFFFLVPSIGIAPKTNLAVYLVVSLVFIFVWRFSILPRLLSPSSRERAVLIASGSDADDLLHEVNNNARYRMYFPLHFSPEQIAADFAAFEQKLDDERISLIVVDTGTPAVQPLLRNIYRLAFVERRFGFSDLYRAYEEVFDRVPLSLLRYDWFLKNVSRAPVGFYAALKRTIDLVGAVVMGVITALITPFIFVAMRLEGPGPLFITQERFGQFGERMRVYKFRTMTFNDAAARTWVGEGHNRVTKVGALLRRTSLDEFPQFINVLRGEMSLVGPRNDIAGLGERLAETIPYYMARYVVKPGITGWAQINQRYEPGNISPQSIEETKGRLSYDFYYIRHRSLGLDILIALRTVKRMLFRVSNW